MGNQRSLVITEVGGVGCNHNFGSEILVLLQTKSLFFDSSYPPQTSSSKTLIIPTYWSELMDIVKIICAILLPPLGVFLQVGIGKDFWINLLLTIFGLYILGLVHAIWVIARER